VLHAALRLKCETPHSQSNRALLNLSARPSFLHHRQLRLSPPESMADAIVDVRQTHAQNAAFCAAIMRLFCNKFSLQLGAVRETTLNEPVQETILRDLRM
jgi:hypothetical protein